MANNVIINAITLVFLISSFVPGAKSIFLRKQLNTIFPTIEVTLSNDSENNKPIYYMCQMNITDSLTKLEPKQNIRFDFTQIAFPMRWCYLYINPKSHGFFWAYTVRARCTKCFWSINKHPFLFRGDRVRWERQKLFVPSGFDISSYLSKNNSGS